ncbi:MAG TPA: DNA recombination protein RmuC [Myxococcales bacterium]|nr:DNA recombination protein RmuC [Myxococcales bacterium]
MIALALLAAALAAMGFLLLRIRDLRAQLAGQAALHRQAADTFAALSQKALQASNEQFLQLARESLGAITEKARGDMALRQQAIGELVRPVRESLEKVEGRIQQLDNGRAALSHQVSSLLAETSNLAKALRAPAVRGRWGEIQLRRVVELAGMVEHCDFAEQQTVQGDDGRLRPDLVVKLPDGKRLVVDAKVPLQAYLDAVEARDEASRRAHLAAHARQLRAHVGQLAKKSYWDQVGTPQFVVLFVPNEAVFAAAMEQDPQLMEGAVAENVLLASPTTLIALLRAAAFGWRQEQLARDAQEIASLGRDLHKRLGRLGEHFARIGKSLGSAVAAYNDTVGSYERMVVPGARKLRDKAAPMDEELPALPDVDAGPRALQPQEVPPLPDDAN